MIVCVGTIYWYFIVFYNWSEFPAHERIRPQLCLISCPTGPFLVSYRSANAALIYRHSCGAYSGLTIKEHTITSTREERCCCI